MLLVQRPAGVPRPTRQRCEVAIRHQARPESDGINSQQRWLPVRRRASRARGNAVRYARAKGPPIDEQQVGAVVVAGSCG